MNSANTLEGWTFYCGIEKRQAPILFLLPQRRLAITKGVLYEVSLKHRRLYCTRWWLVWPGMKWLWCLFQCLRLLYGVCSYLDMLEGTCVRCTLCLMRIGMMRWIWICESLRFVQGQKDGWIYEYALDWNRCCQLAKQRKKKAVTKGPLSAAKWDFLAGDGVDTPGQRLTCIAKYADTVEVDRYRGAIIGVKFGTKGIFTDIFSMCTKQMSRRESMRLETWS